MHIQLYCICIIRGMYCIYIYTYVLHGASFLLLQLFQQPELPWSSTLDFSFVTLTLYTKHDLGESPIHSSSHKFPE